MDVSEGHVDHIKDLHTVPAENETCPESQGDGSSEDAPLAVVEPSEASASVPVPASSMLTRCMSRSFTTEGVF